MQMVGEGEQQQMFIPAVGDIEIGPLDAESMRVWETFGGELSSPNVNDRSNPYNTNNCQVKNDLQPRVQDPRLGCAVEPARGYEFGNDFGAPVGTYHDVGEPNARGQLFYDEQTQTMYAVYPRTGRSVGTWALFQTGDSDLNIFREDRPAVRQKLGELITECDSATWRMQRFAGAIVIQPPADESSCEGYSPNGYVLFDDGTYVTAGVVRPQPSEPTATPAGIPIGMGLFLNGFGAR
jgi:hypothetical protein